MARNTHERILFVAPGDSGLDVLPEIDTIQGMGFWVTTLQGDVSISRLFQTVQHNTFDIIHFACHSNGEGTGLLLSNGELLNIDQTLQAVRVAEANTVFLNACNTARLGQSLVDNDVPIAIVVIGDIKNNIAKRTAQTFYSLLSKTKDINMSYQGSKPAKDGSYLFLTDGGYRSMILDPLMDKLEIISTLAQQNTSRHDTVNNRLDKLEDAVSELLSMRTTLKLLAVFILGMNILTLASQLLR